MSNGFLFNFKTILVVVFLISIRETLRRLHPSAENGSSLNSFKLTKFTPLHWHSRGILQQFNATFEHSTSKPKESVECSHVISKYNSSLLCHYIKTTPDCQLTDGFIQYLYLPYCSLSRNFAFFILVIWLIFLFVVLGVTADDYFCPSLAVISKTLKMSQNVAGVTFLAYGNGAPDIFSAIAAFSHSNGDSSAAELGIEALFGAGVFVTTAVVGCISLCTPNGFSVTQRPFTRDILFYIGAVGWMAFALHNQELSTLESIGLIIFYVVYVMVVIVGRYVYQYWKKKKRAERSINVIPSGNTAISSVLGSQSISTSSLVESCQEGEKEPLIRPVHTILQSIPPGKKLLYGVLPFTCSDWEQSSLFNKIFMVFKAPATFLLNLTVSTIDYTEPDQKWNKWLNVIHCITGPVFIVMATKAGTITVGSHFPVWALALCLGVLLALFVATLTTSNQPPRFHWMFAYLAFVVSVIWIYITANEIVNLLQTFGVVFHLSDAILGLTFLAWGNSIGDLVSNTAMARQGYPNMAASACFGGPMLNLLLGIGISCTYVSVKKGHSVRLPHRFHQYIISASFLTLSLASSGIVIPLMGFRISRSYGIYLLVIYLAYLIISIIAEVKHI